MATNISSLTINATGQKVWEVLTKPELVKQWQYGSNLKTDWTVGGPIAFETEWEGTLFRQWGTVLDFNPVSNLAYTLFAPRPDLEDEPGNYFVMKYVLTETAGKTRLDIIQEDNRPDAVQEDPQGAENGILQALKKVAEGH